MPETIKSGSSGEIAVVDKDKRLWVNALSLDGQQVFSQVKQDAYQIMSPGTTLIDGTTVGMHIENTSSDKDIVLTFIRHQIVGASGGTPFPNTDNYFRLGFGRTYSSGGNELVPVNVYADAGKSAPLTAYKDNPTLAGTIDELDRWYTKADSDMNPFSKLGAVIIAPKRTLELSYVGDRTSGILYSRISFYVQDTV